MDVVNARVSSALAAPMLCGLLAACAYEPPRSTVSPGSEGGITSGNGGGARALGNTLDVGVTTRTSPVTTRTSPSY